VRLVWNELAKFASQLLGRSAYQAPPVSTGGARDIDDPQVVRAREMQGGQIQNPVYSQTRWYLAQLEAAEHDADGGVLERAGMLMRAARMDGVFSGVLSTRTGGLVRLPKRFRGDADVVAALEMGHSAGSGEVRSEFDEMFPPQEAALLAADGVLLGVGVGELVPVEGRAYPVFVRLEPQNLIYRWYDNTWYFNSSVGELRIVPGDGRWVLHTPGGRQMPWVNGIWRAIGRAFIRKEHAQLHCDNWEAKLANPARVAVMPQGGSEAQADSWFRAVMAWGVNTVFGMRPGYDVKLIESNGRGWESFNATIGHQNDEMIIAVAGQLVTVDGGAGFQNSDIHKTIRADLIKDTAEGLAYTVNTQVIPAYVAARWGEAAIDSKQAIVEWDVTPPKDRNQDAQSLVTTANALKLMSEALAPHGMTPDLEALCLRFAVPLAQPEQLGELVPAVEKIAPVLRLVPDVAPDAADALPAPAVDGESDGTESKQDTALNGAQVTSLLEIIGQVSANQLPRESALEILSMAFGWSRDQADRVLGSVGKGFVPASASVPAEPLEPDAPSAPAAPAAPAEAAA
jgi:Protein of unknown function (DUF935)